MQPIRIDKAWAFVNPGGLKEVDRPVYPPSRGPELREARRAARMGLRVAAGRANLSMLLWSGLERGAYVPADEADWRVLFAMFGGGE